MIEKASRGQITMGVVVLLSLFLVELGMIARRTSITWDEDDHIYAGFMSLDHSQQNQFCKGTTSHGRGHGMPAVSLDPWSPGWAIPP